MDENGINQWLIEYIPLEAVIALPALLAATLIPIAIFMIDNKNNLMLPWDQAVVVKKVLHARMLFVIILVLAFLPLLWKETPGLTLAAVLTSSIILALLVREAYRWLVVIEASEHAKSTPDYRARKRKKYLETLSKNEMNAIWSLTWATDKNARVLVNDRELIKTFRDHLEQIAAEDQLAADMIRDFLSHIHNIDLSDPQIHETLTEFSLRWASNLAHQENNNKNRLRFRMTTRRLFFKIMKLSMNDSFMSYLFYTESKKYIRENKLSEPYFVSHLAPNFLEEIDNVYSINDTLQEFPPEWQITSETLRSSNGAAYRWLKAYLHWVTTRNMLTSRLEEFEHDIVADEVTRELLPNIEIIMWSDVVAFYYSPFGSSLEKTKEHDQIRNFIESEKRFGRMSRVYGFWEAENQGNLEDRFDQETEKAIKEVVDIIITTEFFPLLLDPDKLDTYISEIESLQGEYESDSSEAKKLVRLCWLFNKIKKEF